VALIEKEYPKSHGSILKKRKNMNPNATKSLKGCTCAVEDSGVDLNRNYGVDFGVGVKTQVGLAQTDLVDECADPCGECYRGPSPLSEPESQALANFITEHKNEIKFVYNFHSNGNSWVFPYNGRDTNDIEMRSPGMIQIFLEIGNDAQFPKGEKNYGNSHDILGEKIGGDMDDYVLSTFNIPSVTAELGLEE
jgi:hypothetical protein